MAKGSQRFNDYPLRVLAQVNVEGPHFITCWWIYNRKTKMFDSEDVTDVVPKDLKVRFHDMNDGRAIRIINNAKKGG